MVAPPHSAAQAGGRAAGDKLTIRDNHFYVNERDYGAVITEAAGKMLPQINDPAFIGPGEVCLASAVPESLDCRYSGPISQTTLKALATPLWTWGD